MTHRTRRPLDGILLLDKPPGSSSNAVLQRAKWLFQARKAGHTGSLDPLATGLLPVCFGHATKLCGYLLDSDKRYVVRARIGEKTDTADADGEVIETSDAGALQRKEVEAVLPGFTGEIQQRPPMYSALKKDGKRLYELARKGETVERPLRRQTIHELRLLSFADTTLELDVRCSKGTYIRSLVEDIAGALGQCGHVIALRRLESGPFGSQPMHTLEGLEQVAEQGLTALDALLLPTLEGLAGWPRERVDAVQAGRLAHGQAVSASRATPAGRVAVLGPDDRLLGLAEVTTAGELQPRTWMVAAGQ